MYIIICTRFIFQTHSETLTKRGANVSEFYKNTFQAQQETVMRYFTDCIVLFFYCLLGFFYVDLDDRLIFAFLCTVILTSLFYTFENSGIQILLCLLFVAGIFLENTLALFTPLLFYVFLSCGYPLFSMAGIVSVFYVLCGTDFPGVLKAAQIFGTFLAFFLWFYAHTYQEIEHRFHTIQDDSSQRNLLLAEKNKALLEKQDYEIYAATLRERNRIAREIHDNVGHVLSRSILLTGAMKTVCKEETLTPLLSSLELSLNSAMDSIRSSVHDLHDDSVNLEDALKELIGDFTFCPVTFTYDMSRQIPREIKYCFISIAKEGFSNIIRHSNATSVTLIVREHPAMYQFCLQDNGTYVNHPSTYEIANKNNQETRGNFRETFPDNTETFNVSGIGLQNIKDRVKNLNGLIQITNDRGFRIFITIPRK